MPDQLAFTAEPWGNAAVVYRAMEDCPGPIVDQEFGMLWTWTQTHTFATRLNEGLDSISSKHAKSSPARSIAPAISRTKMVQEALQKTFPLPEGSMFVSGGLKSDAHDGQ